MPVLFSKYVARSRADRPLLPGHSRPPNPRWSRVAGILLLAFSLPIPIAGPVLAELRTVTGEGEYRMGDHDTKLDAEHLALESAKRNVLEQVATYLESVTVVRDLDITMDEIRTYTAGLLLILDQESTTRVEDNTVVVHVDLVAQVDSDQVVQAIAALRENEDARQQLAALRGQFDELQQELAEANTRLAAATDPEQIQALTQQRQELLDEARSNTLVSQAWTGWTVGGTNVAVAPGGGYVPATALLVQAWQLAPWSRHVQAAQQRIMPQQPLPQYSRPPLSQNRSQNRLRAAIRPWSGIAQAPRSYRAHPHSNGWSAPSFRMRPANPRNFAPQGSRGGRGGRGRR
jgi:hypothetical protein